MEKEKRHNKVLLSEKQVSGLKNALLQSQTRLTQLKKSVIWDKKILHLAEWKQLMFEYQNTFVFLLYEFHEIMGDKLHDLVKKHRDLISVKNQVKEENNHGKA